MLKEELLNSFTAEYEDDVDTADDKIAGGEEMDDNDEDDDEDAGDSEEI